MKTIAWLDRTGKANWNVFSSYSNYPKQLSYFEPIENKWSIIKRALSELKHTDMIEIWLVNFKVDKDNNFNVKPLRLILTK